MRASGCGTTWELLSGELELAVINFLSVSVDRNCFSFVLSSNLPFSSLRSAKLIAGDYDGGTRAFALGEFARRSHANFQRFGFAPDDGAIKVRFAQGVL